MYSICCSVGSVSNGGNLLVIFKILGPYLFSPANRRVVLILPSRDVKRFCLIPFYCALCLLIFLRVGFCFLPHRSVSHSCVILAFLPRVLLLEVGDNLDHLALRLCAFPSLAVADCSSQAKIKTENSRLLFPSQNIDREQQIAVPRPKILSDYSILVFPGQNKDWEQQIAVPRPKI